MSGEFDAKSRFILGHAIARAVDAFYSISKNRSPLGKIAGITKNAENIARLQVTFGYARYSLRSHNTSMSVTAKM